MAWLNYQHLYYFWMVAREGGLARAAAALRLSHSTLSVQIRALEDQLGEPLFERRGRALALTPFGREIQQYATDIFRLGDELLEFSAGQAVSRRRLEVGVAASIPKTIVARLLQPALDAAPDAAFRVRQDPVERLLLDLAGGRLHAVVLDAAPALSGGLRLHAHALGASEVLLYGSAALAERYRARFPAGLDGAPLLMPGPDTVLRRAIERWLGERGVRPRIVGEVDDAGTLRALGAAGRGLFPVRAALRSEVEESSGARWIGHLDGVVEPYFAVTVDRRISHPAVSALVAAARDELGHRPRRPRRRVRGR